MGLDMYLEGETFIWTDWKNLENNQYENGFRVKGHKLELGYWRKHPNLHGFIVSTFAEGEDNCQRIDLSRGDLQEILKAVKEKALPNTTGFFFGASSAEDDKPTIEILEKAIAWLDGEGNDGRESRSAYYRASW